MKTSSLYPITQEKITIFKNQSGFTLNELLIVTILIGILVAMAVPEYLTYQKQSYDSNTKISLVQLYTACKVYWNDHGGSNSCDVKVLNSKPSYGYQRPEDIIFNITDGKEASFGATGQHSESPTIFKMDYRGRIT